MSTPTATAVSSSQPITRREWRVVLLVALGFTLLLQLPYLLGYLTTPDSAVFTGLLMNPEDSQTYLAKMLQGYDGAWRYTIPFTFEPHEGEFVGVFYVWLGQLARALGLTVEQTWHAARVAADVVLIGVTYWFISLFLARQRARRLAFLLALFGSGLGWLLFLLGQPYWLGYFPIDFKQPGAHLFFTALTFPHIILGTACILGSLGLLWRMGLETGDWGLETGDWGLETGDWRLEIDPDAATPNRQSPISNLYTPIAAGLIHVILGITYPFLIYLVTLTAVFLYLYATIQQRRILWRLGIGIAVAFAIPAPLYLYYAQTLFTNSVFRAWDAQAVTLSAPWPHYLLAYGPMLLLAGAYAWRRPVQNQRVALLWAWLLAVALLLYAPLNPQRRFVQGVHVALSILTAAAFLELILPWLKQTRPFQSLIRRPRYTTAGMEQLLTIGFLAFMSLSNVYVLLSVSVSAVVQQPDPLFRPRDEVEATRWLRKNVARDAIVVGAYQTGNYVAAQAGQRVVVGHWAETVEYEQKETAVSRFYNTKTSNQWRRDWLQQIGVDIVWWGPRERELGAFDLETADYLQPMYHNNTIRLYRVELPMVNSQLSMNGQQAIDNIRLTINN